MVRIDTSGLKKLQRTLEDLRGSHEVSTTELMTDAFIRTETSFNSWEEVMDAGNIESSDDLESEAFSEFIRTNTKFDGFQDMIETAAQSYVVAKLGLK